MPAATAMTFFSAPPSSTPTRSVLEYNRRRGPFSAAATREAKAASADATVSAVGRPCATSRAKLGPESLVAQGPAAGLEALAQPHDGRVAAQRGQRRAQARHGRGDHEQPALGEAHGVIEVGRHVQRRRQADLGEIAVIAA